MCMFICVSVCVWLPHPLQAVVELHGLQEEVLLCPQGAAQLGAQGSELAAAALEGVLRVVRVLDQRVALLGQSRGSVQ